MLLAVVVVFDVVDK